MRKEPAMYLILKFNSQILILSLYAELVGLLYVIQKWDSKMDNFIEIKELFESSFLPLRCDVANYDYGEFLKFRIKNNLDEILYEKDKLSSDIYDNSMKLNTLIFEIRQYLISEGFHLDT
jgi:hypothetical protein